MKLAFVCGPYRADTHDGVYRNIQKAREVSAWLWKLGYAVICPHLNSAFMSGVCDEERFLSGYLEILSRCDILVCFGGSYGADKEMETAEKIGIPVVTFEAMKQMGNEMPDAITRHLEGK